MISKTEECVSLIPQLLSYGYFVSSSITNPDDDLDDDLPERYVLTYSAEERDTVYSSVGGCLYR